MAFRSLLRRGLIAAGLSAFILFTPPAGKHGLAEETFTEKERLAQCEKDLCGIILEREKNGSRLACDLAQTVDKEAIKKALEDKRLTWPLGSARCAVNFNVERGILVSALEDDKHTLIIPRHTVNCEVERNETRYPVNLTLSPKIQFKDGKAEKVSLGVGDIEAPRVIKGVIWSVSKLEENFGLFQADLVKHMNKFIAHHCGKKFGGKKV